MLKQIWKDILGNDLLQVGYHASITNILRKRVTSETSSMLSLKLIQTVLFERLISSPDLLALLKSLEVQQRSLWSSTFHQAGWRPLPA